MESAGSPGVVQLTRAAWDLTGLPVSLAEQRTLRVKGKAEEMDVVLVDTGDHGRAAEIMSRLQEGIISESRPQRMTTPRHNRVHPISGNQ
jgi:hypothetical protein